MTAHLLPAESIRLSATGEMLPHVVRIGIGKITADASILLSAVAKDRSTSYFAAEQIDLHFSDDRDLVMDSDETFDTSTLDQTAHIVAAYVSNNRVAEADLPALISSVFSALTSTTAAAQSEPEPAPLVPAVSVKKSVTDDYIVCLEDGKKFKSLKRHLMTHYDLTPDAYRAKWKLPADYPMVAPNYAAARSALAKSMGLGRKAASAEAEAEPSQKAPKARGSRKMQEAAE